MWAQIYDLSKSVIVTIDYNDLRWNDDVTLKMMATSYHDAILLFSDSQEFRLFFCKNFHTNQSKFDIRDSREINLREMLVLKQGQIIGMWLTCNQIIIRMNSLNQNNLNIFDLESGMLEKIICLDIDHSDIRDIQMFYGDPIFGSKKGKPYFKA